MKPELFIGEKAPNNLKEHLKIEVSKRIFLVRGKESYFTCGAHQFLVELFSDQEFVLFEFFDFEENPKYEDLQKGLSFLQKTNADIIIAIGGGSVLDMAKLIRFFHSYSGDPTASEFLKQKELKPLYALPTTAGTGSEATHFAVLYQNKIKYSVAHKDITPDIALINPAFTYHTPAYLTACSGFDALSQAIEAYWNINATEVSDEYAIRAIKLLLPNIPQAVLTSIKKCRDEISEGSFWAGKAINITKTTAPHAFSYPFTSHYGYPHGHAVALTFPVFAELNIDHIDKHKRETLFNLFEVDSSSQVKTFFQEYLSAIGLSLRFNEKVDRNLILSQINTQRLNNNPLAIDRLRASDILDTILQE